MSDTAAAHDALDARQFTLAVRRLADDLSYGSDRSPFLGAGLEYVQSRPYQPGDPVKCMDWRLTARTGRHHVKEYEAPKRTPVYLLVDTSASMAASSRRLSKYAWAVQLAGGLALAALYRVSPVGVLGCGGRDLDVRPSLSRTQVFQWLHALRHPGWDEPTALARRLRQLAAVLPHRALLVVLSDLHDPGALEALRPLAPAHDCLVLELRDPAEAGRLGGGFLRAAEAETDAAFVTRGAARWLDLAANAPALRRAGVDHLVLRTDEPFVARLSLHLRRRDFLGKGTR
jgi:uncharacterized protein (DUF58 family)